ncbi:MAG: biopolymer transport protein ExbB [Mariniblastus sp.]|jgi:biopolymer transport protein ExbB
MNIRINQNEMAIQARHGSLGLRRAICFGIALVCFSCLPVLGWGQEITNINGFDTPGPEVATPAVQTGLDADAGQSVIGPRRLTDIVKSGGPLMIPIGVCSFILVVFVFERFISLRKGRIIPGPFTKRFLEQLREGDLNVDSATTICDRNKSAMAVVFRAGIQKWGRPAVEIEQAVLDEGERASNRLRKYLRLINGVATVCPLLGLLGTVLGMIHAFDSIATVSATVSDPKALIATGISQALLTTAAGLSVAIPALIAYLFFSSRVDKHVMEIDSLGMKVVNLISAEAITANSKPRSRKAA